MIQKGFFIITRYQLVVLSFIILKHVEKFFQPFFNKKNFLRVFL